EAYAAHEDSFPDRRTSTEELFANAAAKEDDTTTLDLISGGDPTTFAGNLVAKLSVFGADAANSGIHEAIAIGHGESANCLHADRLHHRRCGADEFNIFLLEVDG